MQSTRRPALTRLDHLFEPREYHGQGFRLTQEQHLCKVPDPVRAPAGLHLLLKLRLEMRYRVVQAVKQLDIRGPAEFGYRQTNVGTTACRVVLGKRFKDDPALAAGLLDHQLGQFVDCELLGIAQIAGA